MVPRIWILEYFYYFIRNYLVQAFVHVWSPAKRRSRVTDKVCELHLKSSPGKHYRPTRRVAGGNAGQLLYHSGIKSPVFNTLGGGGVGPVPAQEVIYPSAPSPPLGGGCQVGVKRKKYEWMKKKEKGTMNGWKGDTGSAKGRRGWAERINGEN